MRPNGSTLYLAPWISRHQSSKLTCLDGCFFQSPETSNHIPRPCNQANEGLCLHSVKTPDSSQTASPGQQFSTRRLRPRSRRHRPTISLPGSSEGKGMTSTCIYGVILMMILYRYIRYEYIYIYNALRFQSARPRLLDSQGWKSSGASRISTRLKFLKIFS